MNLLSSLRYLVALNEHRHFGRAAVACHITQPALSNALRALEAEFGVVIAKRDRNFVGLTPEGERVLASAQRMLHEHAVLQQELQSEVHLPRGALSIAAVPTAVPIAARFAAMLRARHEGIRPVVLAMRSDALEQGLEDLSIDLGLGYSERTGIKSSRFCVWPQYGEQYFLLRKATAPNLKELRFGKPMQWREAADLPLCLLTPDMHNRTLVDNAFQMAGVSVRPAMETNSILTMVLSVMAGDVCSILPGTLVDTVRADANLEALHLVGPEVNTPIAFLSNANASPSRALEVALRFLQTPDWAAHVDAHGGHSPT